MKWLTYVGLIIMTIFMVLAIPPPSNAGGTQVFVGARYGGGHPGYGGGGYHRGYGGYHGGYGGYRGGYGHYHHGSGSHYSFGASILLGPPWYYSPYYAPYYYPYYAAPPVVVQTPPPVYYSQPQAQPEQRESYWYYCQDPPGYYPYVKSCPGGWMKVVPETTPPTQ